MKLHNSIHTSALSCRGGGDGVLFVNVEGLPCCLDMTRLLLVYGMNEIMFVDVEIQVHVQIKPFNRIMCLAFLTDPSERTVQIKLCPNADDIHSTDGGSDI